MSFYATGFEYYPGTLDLTNNESWGISNFRVYALDKRSEADSDNQDNLRY